MHLSPSIRKDDGRRNACGDEEDALSAHAREEHGTKKALPSRYLFGPDCLFAKDLNLSSLRICPACMQA